MKTDNILIAVLLTILMAISSAKAEEIKIMEVTEQTIAASAAKTESQPVMGNETPVHDDSHMKDEKGHKHDDEGMHGMIGHHMAGWGIVIGILMIAMMVVVVAR